MLDPDQLPAIAADLAAILDRIDRAPVSPEQLRAAALVDEAVVLVRRAAGIDYAGRAEQLLERLS